MGNRKIVVRQNAANSIAKIAWFIESNGLVATAEKFADGVYDHFNRMGNKRRVYPICREPGRASLGLKCIPYKKYTIVFIESETQLIICEFISSKLIYW